MRFPSQGENASSGGWKLIGCSCPQGQEGEALLSLPMEPSVTAASEHEPSETMSHDTARSSDTMRPQRPPQATRAKHPSGSNVSFSHDTEGGEEDSVQVREELLSWIWHEVTCAAYSSHCPYRLYYYVVHMFPQCDDNLFCMFVCMD